MMNTPPRPVSIYPILSVNFVGALGFSIVLPFRPVGRLDPTTANTAGSITRPQPYTPKVLYRGNPNPSIFV